MISAEDIKKLREKTGAGISDIKKALDGAGIEISKVFLDKPLKSLGEHKVEIELGFGIKTKIEAVLKKKG